MIRLLWARLRGRGLPQTGPLWMRRMLLPGYHPRWDPKDWERREGDYWRTVARQRRGQRG